MSQLLWAGTGTVTWGQEVLTQNYHQQVDLPPYTLSPWETTVLRAWVHYQLPEESQKPADWQPSWALWALTTFLQHRVGLLWLRQQTIFHKHHVGEAEAIP